MAHQPMRGSKAGHLKAVADTLELALSGASDEAELRSFIKTVIKGIRNEKPPKLKPDTIKEKSIIKEVRKVKLN